jgi:hypothetical protein
VLTLSAAEKKKEEVMKLAFAAFAALLLGATGWSPPAEAQRAPQGSYLGSCVGVVVRGDNLAATCRKPDGTEQRSQISGFRRCTGDIGNANGVLHCNFPGGPVWGVVTGRGGPPAPAYVSRAPAYVPPAYAPAPGYVPPPAGWEQAHWQRCRHLHERVEELRDRREHTYGRSASASSTDSAGRGQSSSAAADPSAGPRCGGCRIPVDLRRFPRHRSPGIIRRADLPRRSGRS